jgi:glyoxylase-like metal-dependent hydrolase (beta-lactamase superfamily II)
MPETYEVLAVKYAHHKERTRIDNFMLPDDHGNHEPIDYFLWVIRNSNRTIIVDTGMDRAEAEGRGRTFIRRPNEALDQIGIDSGAVDNVIVTHMHFDHARTLDDFPSARFHLRAERDGAAIPAQQSSQTIFRDAKPPKYREILWTRKRPPLAGTSWRS